MTTTRQDDSHTRFFARTVPRSFDFIGLANVAAWVTVNGDPAYRKAEYYRKEVTVSTGNNSAYTDVTSRATVGESDQTQVGSNFTPAATETFVHDGDGNLTQDGSWDYAWNGENRLIRMTTRADLTVAPVRRIEFEYDWLGRRIGKLVYNARSGGTLLSTARFLYDGWNLLAELDGSNNRVRTYMWGLGLSGSAQGAGGVGGLLKVTCYGPTTTNAFGAYDGNRVKGWFRYSMLCACPIRHCAEQEAYSAGVAAAQEAMKSVPSEDQLALRCLLASFRSSCRAEKRECDVRFRTKHPGGPSCD